MPMHYDAKKKPAKNNKKSLHGNTPAANHARNMKAAGGSKGGMKVGYMKSGY